MTGEGAGAASAEGKQGAVVVATDGDIPADLQETNASIGKAADTEKMPPAAHGLGLGS